MIKKETVRNQAFVDQEVIDKMISKKNNVYQKIAKKQKQMSKMLYEMAVLNAEYSNLTNYYTVLDKNLFFLMKGVTKIKRKKRKAFKTFNNTKDIKKLNDEERDILLEKLLEIQRLRRIRSDYNERCQKNVDKCF